MKALNFLNLIFKKKSVLIITVIIDLIPFYLNKLLLLRVLIP